MNENIKEYTAKILGALQETMNNEDSEHFIDLREANITELIHVMTNIVPNLFYSEVTGEDINFLEFNHIANKLCFDFMDKK
jgi:hypothetical protein